MWKNKHQTNEKNDKRSLQQYFDPLWCLQLLHCWNPPHKISHMKLILMYPHSWMRIFSSFSCVLIRVWEFSHHSHQFSWGWWEFSLGWWEFSYCTQCVRVNPHAPNENSHGFSCVLMCLHSWVRIFSSFSCVCIREWEFSQHSHQFSGLSHMRQSVGGSSFSVVSSVVIMTFHRFVGLVDIGVVSQCCTSHHAPTRYSTSNCRIASIHSVKHWLCGKPLWGWQMQILTLNKLWKFIPNKFGGPVALDLLGANLKPFSSRPTSQHSGQWCWNPNRDRS